MGVEAARFVGWAMLVASVLLSNIPPASVSAETLFDERPVFSQAEYPAKKWARCNEIKSMSEGLVQPEYRIDLSVFGELGLVTTDGTLWYLGVCGAPDEVKVLCVTYSANGMKVGDKVYLKGAYRRAGPDHIVLDPCLADWPDGGTDPQR
jgi:hypothetical protein